MARTRNVEQFEEQRRAILAAAARAFMEHGFHATGIAEICAAAGGMSPGRLYHYFPSKQAIVAAIVAEERASTAALLSAVEEADDIPAAIVSAIAAAARACADGDYGRLALEIVAEAARNPAVGAVVVEADAEDRAAVARAVRAGQAKGQIDPATEPESIARLVVALLDGVTGRTLIEADVSPEDLARQVGWLVERLLPGGERT